MASSVDYERYEEAEFHDLLSRSEEQASESSYQLVYDLLSLVNILGTSVVVLMVLVGAVPEVLPALLLIAVPSVIAARASAHLAFQTTYDLTPNDRLRTDLFTALTGKRTARELRVFGIAGLVRSRWDRLYDERMDRIRALVTRQVVFNGLAVLVGALLVGGVLLILVQAAVDDRISSRMPPSRSWRCSSSRLGSGRQPRHPGPSGSRRSSWRTSNGSVRCADPTLRTMLTPLRSSAALWSSRGSPSRIRGRTLRSSTTSASRWHRERSSPWWG